MKYVPFLHYGNTRKSTRFVFDTYEEARRVGAETMASDEHVEAFSVEERDVAQ